MIVNNFVNSAFSFSPRNLPSAGSLFQNNSFSSHFSHSHGFGGFSTPNFFSPFGGPFSDPSFSKPRGAMLNQSMVQLLSSLVDRLSQDLNGINGHSGRHDHHAGNDRQHHDPVRTGGYHRHDGHHEANQDKANPPIGRGFRNAFPGFQSNFFFNSFASSPAPFGFGGGPAGSFGGGFSQFNQNVVFEQNVYVNNNSPHHVRPEPHHSHHHDPHCEYEPHTPPPPPPPPSYTPIETDPGSRIWGDPHFVGAEGGKYDVQGEAGKTYNLLSDQNLQVNATFGSWGSKGATVMKDIGVTHGNNFVQIGVGGQLNINGEDIANNGEYLNGMVTKNDDAILFKSNEYNLSFENKKDHINIDFTSTNVLSDGVLPHGLWGQTVDGDGIARNGDRGAGAQGGGAIENAQGVITEKGDKSAVSLYEVSGLRDTNFEVHNKFSTTFDPEAQQFVMS